MRPRNCASTPHFDYVIINDEVEKAARQLASIIYAERARCMRQESLVREVIQRIHVGTE